MTVPAEIHKNDIGTTIKVTIHDEEDEVVDISSASTKQLIFTKPNNSGTVTKSASFTTDGTDGQMQYTTIASDLDTVGMWRIQAYVVLSSGQWHSNIFQFKVYENL